MAKKQAETTDLATTNTGALAPAPSYITDGAAGFENQQQGDLVFPRAVLMQALSPAVADKNAEAGQIVNSVTNDVFAEPGQKRAVVPVMFWHEWIEWGDRDAGGGMIDRSQDPESDLAKRCKAGEKIERNGREVPAITEYLVFLMQPVDTEIPCDATQMFCVCLAKTNYKHGRKLLTLARMRGNKPLFAGVYNIYSIEEKNAKGQRYYVFNFTNAGWAPEAVFNSLSAEYEKLKEVVVMASAPAAEEERSGAVVDEEL